MNIEDLISKAQGEVGAVSDPRLKSGIWWDWACNAITAAFAVDSCLRIQPGMTVLDATFAPDSSTSPTPVPASLAPYTVSLQKYIEFRYHGNSPENAEQRAAAIEKYQMFLAGLGVQAKG